VNVLQVIECSCKDDTNISAIFKAYLSLAKVSLTSAVSASIKSRPNSAMLSKTEEQPDEQYVSSL